MAATRKTVPRFVDQSPSPASNPFLSRLLGFSIDRDGVCEDPQRRLQQAASCRPLMYRKPSKVEKLGIKQQEKVIFDYFWLDCLEVHPEPISLWKVIRVF